MSNSKQAELAIKRTARSLILKRGDRSFSLNLKETKLLKQALETKSKFDNAQTTMSDVRNTYQEFLLLEEYVKLARRSIEGLRTIFNSNALSLHKLTPKEKSNVTQHSVMLNTSIVELNASIDQFNYLNYSSIVRLDVDDIYTEDGFTLETLEVISYKLNEVVGCEPESD